MPFTDTDMVIYTPMGAYDDWGPTCVPLDPRTLRKIASASYVPTKIAEFADQLRSRDDGRYVLLNALGAGEFYGCFTESNTLQTDRGFLSIKDVEVGDQVEARSGQFRRVLSKFEFTHHTRGIEIEVRGLIDPIVSTEKHHFLRSRREDFVCARDRYKRCLPETRSTQNICLRPAALKLKCAEAEFVKPGYASADDLRLRDYLLCPLPEHDQKAAMSLLESRAAGLWIAEGSFIHQRSALSCKDGIAYCFATDETQLVETVSSFGKFRGANIHGPYPGNGDCVSIRLMDTALAYKFKTLFGEYAAEKKIPYWFIRQPEGVILELLAGYFDGDGTVNHKDSCVSATTASKNLALGIQRLLWSVQIPATVCPVKKHGHYRINFSIERGLSLYTRMIKGDKHIPLGKSHYQQFFIDGYVALPIKGLKRISLKGQKTYDLEVEEEHSYVIGQVAVHNSNKNGDYFNEWSLLGDTIPPDVQEFIRDKGLPIPAEWGYKTFERYAYPYKHHDNDDPAKSCGERVCCADYNHKMHRVELIVFIRGDKAPDVIRKIDAGDPVAFSMGARLPFDVCSICRKPARRKDEYCDHLKSMLNYVFPDGRKVFAYNYFPRFFDISIVTVPADRSAYSLKKVAEYLQNGQAKVVWSPGMDYTTIVPNLNPREDHLASTGMEKFASLFEFLASGGKTSVADIDKMVSPHSECGASEVRVSPITPDLMDVVKDLVDKDQTAKMPISDNTMSTLKQFPLNKVLSGLTSLGIVLPEDDGDELIGDQELPENLESLDFPEEESTLINVLKRLIPGRSMFNPHFSIRLVRMSRDGAEGQKPEGISLIKSGSTSRYRRWLSTRVDLDKLAERIQRPEVRMILFPGELEKEIVGLSGDSMTDEPDVLTPFIVEIGA